MKTKSKSKKARRVATAKLVPVGKVPEVSHRHVIPAKDRRLSFGNKWDYAPAPEAFEYIKIPPRHELFINGKFVPPRSGKYFESLNPATEEQLSEIADADAQDVNAAVKAARRAYDRIWRKMSGRERGK